VTIGLIKVKSYNALLRMLLVSNRSYLVTKRVARGRRKKNELAIAELELLHLLQILAVSSCDFPHHMSPDQASRMSNIFYIITREMK
jgi:hypothetical protein